ncbi:hypothetical protein D4764_14G0003010 [Takifugu flavidus]|uniref:Uncharacterized protein n=1 Tax=Takifugu flavidus TaxID=433684 RepID=A0A5C6P7V1_9TELE|nr:hypothetical protein D4764_14G0003010 [Takifugu flavidus]
MDGNVLAVGSEGRMRGKKESPGQDLMLGKWPSAFLMTPEGSMIETEHRRKSSNDTNVFLHILTWMFLLKRRYRLCPSNCFDCLSWAGCPVLPVLFISLMDRISRRSQGPGGVQNRNHMISLLFADGVGFINLLHVLSQFAAEYEAAAMGVYPLRVGGEVLPQAEQFRYLGVLFMSEGKMEGETDRGIGAAAAVMKPVYQTVMVKREHSHKAPLASVGPLSAALSSSSAPLARQVREIDTSGEETWGSVTKLCAAAAAADTGAPARVRSTLLMERDGGERATNTGILKRERGWGARGRERGERRGEERERRGRRERGGRKERERERRERGGEGERGGRKERERWEEGEREEGKEGRRREKGRGKERGESWRVELKK